MKDEGWKMKDEGWNMKDECWMLKDEGLRLKGVLTNEWTDICDCRVAFATENCSGGDICTYKREILYSSFLKKGTQFYGVRMNDYFFLKYHCSDIVIELSGTKIITNV